MNSSIICNNNSVDAVPAANKAMYLMVTVTCHNINGNANVCAPFTARILKVEIKGIVQQIRNPIGFNVGTSRIFCTRCRALPI